MATVTSRSSNRARSAEVRALTNEAVERLLSQGSSYTSLSYQRIAKEVGIPRTTLYLEFRDKNELLIAISKASTKDIFAAAATWFEASHEGGIADVNKYVGQMITTFAEHKYVLGALLEVAAYDEEISTYWYGLLAEFIETAALEMPKNGNASRLRKDIDVKATVEAVTLMVERSIAVYFARNETNEKLTETLSRIIWSSFYPDF